MENADFFRDWNIFVPRLLYAYSVQFLFFIWTIHIMCVIGMQYISTFMHVKSRKFYNTSVLYDRMLHDS